MYYTKHCACMPVSLVTWFSLVYWFSLSLPCTTPSMCMHACISWQRRSRPTSEIRVNTFIIRIIRIMNPILLLYDDRQINPLLYTTLEIRVNTFTRQHIHYTYYTPQYFYYTYHRQTYYRHTCLQYVLWTSMPVICLSRIQAHL